MTEFVLAVALGLLFGLGTFLVLRRDVVRAVWGVAIISQSANLYLVTVGIGSTGGAGAPVLGHGHGGGASVVDPLVQALVLTAIVIGFGTTAFALVLTYRLYEEHGTIDLDNVAGGRDGGADEPDAGEAGDASGPDSAGTGVGADG